MCVDFCPGKVPVWLSSLGMPGKLGAKVLCYLSSKASASTWTAATTLAELRLPAKSRLIESGLFFWKSFCCRKINTFVLFFGEWKRRVFEVRNILINRKSRLTLDILIQVDVYSNYFLQTLAEEPKTFLVGISEYNGGCSFLIVVTA